MSGRGMSEPPEGAIVGDSVPLENQEVDIEDSKIDRIVGELKLRGEPYIGMKRKELESKAVEIIESYGGK